MGVIVEGGSCLKGICENHLGSCKTQTPQAAFVGSIKFVDDIGKAVANSQS